MIYHTFKHSVDGIALPEQFTCPFCYTAHPLARIAAMEVQEYLAERSDWQAELDEGKMFGVLVVRDEVNDTIGYISAFSGNLDGKNNHEFFVPPVFNFLPENGTFKTEERQISRINRQIADLETSQKYIETKRELANYQTETANETALRKAEVHRRKIERQQIRVTQTDAETLTRLTRESQFDKAELKRFKRRRAETEAELASKIAEIDNQIVKLKNERHHRSAVLQRWLFANFRMLNAQGERRSLNDIFVSTAQRVPPSGAGECAAPKMLQYAYIHKLTPICMAEFWYGRSPKGVVRKHGNFYPACHSKCEPILNYMLQGLSVETNKLLQPTENQIDIIYEDEWLVVVNKPCGLLSEPGISQCDCVAERLKILRPEIKNPLIVHRLDMATSGLLIVAKDTVTQSLIRSMFERREIHKQYVALLSGNVPIDSGTIDLPLSPDINDRPRQIVDRKNGKPAVTKFVVEKRFADVCRVRFFPLTGRTHQLRIHAASTEGLGCPIVGDNLYGEPAERLYLHAEVLDFQNPHTHQLMHFEKPADF